METIRSHGHRHNRADVRLAPDIVEGQTKRREAFEPHTIWECCSPTGHKPATNGDAKLSRQDFRGRSVLFRFRC